MSPTPTPETAPDHRRKPASGLSRSLTACTLVLGVLVVGLTTPWLDSLVSQASQISSDFQILHAAGRGLAEGLDIHDPEVLDGIGRRDGRPATPFCAANPLVIRLYGLLARHDLPTAYSVALKLNLALAALAVLLLASVLACALRWRDRADLGRAGKPSRGIWLACFAIALGAMGLGEGLWMSLAMNSTNLLATAALLGALHAACFGRPVLEGFCLALAAVAKVSPLWLVVVVALAGRRRAVISAGVSLLAMGLASVAWSGWAIHASWFTRVLPVLGYAPELEAGRFNNSLHSWNLAPNGVLSRAMLEADAPRLMAMIGAWAVTALVCVQLWFALRSGTGHGQGAAPSTLGREPVFARLREYGLGVVAMLLISSVTWPHHLVFLAVPTGAVLARLLFRERSLATWVASACLLVLALPLGSLDESADLALGIPLRTAALVVLFAALVPQPGGTTS